MRFRKERWIFLTLAALALAGCSDDGNPPGTDTVLLDSGIDGSLPDTGLPDTGLTDTAPTDTAQPDAAGPKAISVKVVHVNDTHSQVEPKSLTVTFDIQGNKEQTGVMAGGYARLVAKMNDLRSKSANMLALHAGDAVQGTLYFVKHGAKADLDLLNLMGLDAYVLGNHEFDKGPQIAADLVAGATFPVLGANIDVSNEPLLKGKIKAYEVKVIDGEQVAILGLTTKDTAEISSPGTTVTFSDPVARAKVMMQAVGAKGINKVILLSHLGYDEDQKLAQAVEGIDVIVGGHTHTALGSSTDFGAIGVTSAGDYPTMVKDPTGKDVCVVQAWSSTQALGVLDVDWDKDGNVTKCAGTTLLPVSDAFTQYDPVQKKVVPVDAAKKTQIEQVIQASPVIEIVQEDTAAAAKVATYKQAVDALMNQVVSNVTVVDDLWHVRVPGMTHPTAGKMDKGSYIAPHAAQSLLFKAAQLGLQPDIALVNGGGVRCDVPAGSLTMGKVYELMPFFNTLYIVKLSGKDIRDSLDAAVIGAVDSSKTGRFPYLAGARYTADMTKPAGQRITALELSAAGTWTVIDPTKQYTVVTNAFIAGGGDGYSLFASAAYRKDLSFAVDSDVFVEYAQDAKTLTKPADTGVTLIPATP